MTLLLCIFNTWWILNLILIDFEPLPFKEQMITLLVLLVPWELTFTDSREIIAVLGCLTALSHYDFVIDNTSKTSFELNHSRDCVFMTVCDRVALSPHQHMLLDPLENFLWW